MRVGMKQLILGWRAAVENRQAQRALSREVRRLLYGHRPIKLVIGAAAGQHFDGWLMTNLPVFNALKVEHWGTMFPSGCIDRILAEHVIEHWHEGEFVEFLRIVRPFLSRAGTIRLAVPDGLHPDPHYIEYVRPGGSGAGSDDHKVLYTYKKMGSISSRAGYACTFLEHFDETGQFHAIPWDIQDGFIKRSSRYDPRNETAPLSYTSLMVDLKPQ